MKRKIFVGFVLLFISTVYLGADNRKINFNKDWKFHRGSLANAETPKYNDSEWRILDLPHDWSVEPAPIQKKRYNNRTFF